MSDEQVEVHIVWLPSAGAFAGDRDDSARAAHAEPLARSGAALELLELHDCPVS